MADRTAKLRKLNAFRRHRPHMSASALSEVLQAVQDEGVPELHNRNHLREARNLQCSDPTPFGPILQDINCTCDNGRQVRIPIAHPAALLFTALVLSTAFNSFVNSRMDVAPSSPETPWNLVLYSDEVTPGNPLSAANKRKFQAVYWTFLEFGTHALSREESWFCIMTEYSPVVNSVGAAMSQVFGSLIKVFFDPNGFNFQTGGINLPIGIGNRRLWAKLGVFIQDGEAMRATWMARVGKCRLCMLCDNIFTEESDIAAADGTRLLRCNAVHEDDLVPATDASLRNAARHVEAKFLELPFMGVTAFEDLQKALGVTHKPFSILLDRSLDDIVKPASSYMHDWMHTLFSDGIVNLMVSLLFEAFIDDGRTEIYSVVHGYVDKWNWPSKHYSAHLAEIFSEDRKEKHRKAQHIKCQASDMLSLFPVIAYFVQSVLLPSGRCTMHCKAFLALADAVEFITSVSRGRVSPNMIRGAVQKFLVIFLATWGPTYLTPKLHWLLHFAKTFEVFGVLIACFVTERYHRNPKRYATELQNKSKNASACLLKEVTCHSLARLEVPTALTFNVCLIGPRKPTKAVKKKLMELLEADPATIIDPISIANEARFNVFGTCSKNDVVLITDGDGFKAAKVLLHFGLDDDCITIVNVWSLKSIDRAAGYSEWNVSHEALLIATCDILDTVTWTRLDGDVVGILLPCEFR